MRRAALLLVVCLVSLVASAQYGWQYQFQGHQAILISKKQFLEGGYDSYTRLAIAVNDLVGRDAVFIGLHGYGQFNFRKNQLFVLVSFDDGERQKWSISEFDAKDSNIQMIVVNETERFIERLRECEKIDVTLPIFERGNITFNLDTGGYPLDW